MNAAIKCIYYLGIIAEMLAIPAQDYFNGSTNSAVFFFVFLMGAALACMAGIILAKIAHNWLYLIANIILTIWIMLPTL